MKTGNKKKEECALSFLDWAYGRYAATISIIAGQIIIGAFGVLPSATIGRM